MDIIYSSTLMDDLWRTVRTAISSNGTVNISVLAEGVRKRNEAENIALEDIERLLLEVATHSGAAVEFGEDDGLAPC
jgi:hypothetical protein